MRTFGVTRISRAAAELLGVVVLAGLGLCRPELCNRSFSARFYWAGVALLAGVWLWHAGLRRFVGRWQWDGQLRRALPGLGGELNGLMAAALAIKERQEERALYILENLRSPVSSFKFPVSSLEFPVSNLGLDGAKAEPETRNQKPDTCASPDSAGTGVSSFTFPVSSLRSDGARAELETRNQKLETRAWLAALARVSWLARQRPPRPLSAHHRFPQLHALAFSGAPARVPLRHESLLRELAEAAPADLDSLAREFICLHDLLAASIGHGGEPFAEEAEQLLAFTTGHACLIGARDYYVSWWSKFRPVLARGGGAVLIGARLLQRQAYGEAARLLTELAEAGVLSAEADTLRRAACFLNWFSRSQWPMTSADIPLYFTEGYYHLAMETGVLRYPTASLPEVVDCCRRGKLLRDSKKRLIEDALVLWETFDAGLDTQLAVLLGHLLEDKSRGCPWVKGLQYWRRKWAQVEPAYERSSALLMEAIAATADGRLDAAARLFEDVAQLEPESSLPLVNLVQVQLLAGKQDEARILAAAIERQFPEHDHTLIALGRLFATHLGDRAEAERLYLKALETLDPPTEALIRLGEVKLEQGAYMEAQAYFDHARHIDPRLPDPKLGLARTYMETRNHKRAIEHLQSVAETGQASEARDLAHFLLYQVYRELGQDRLAFECLDKVPPRFFNEPDILDDIAGHLESTHRYAKAQEFSERAMLLRAGGGGRADDWDAVV